MPRLDDLRVGGVLPTPKGVALAVMELCQSDSATMEEVARTVMTDPALSGRLIRQANAAASAGRPVVSINEAVRRLGLGLVKQLVLGFSLIDEFSDGHCAAFDYQQFWSHSLLMGLSMQTIARVSRMGPPDDLFACGLLARIGRLALATAYPSDYAEVLQATREGSAAELAEAERERLHIDHNRLGAAMLGEWGFPPALVEPVLFHEQGVDAPFAEGTRNYQICQALSLAARIGDLGLAPEFARHALVAELLAVAGRIGILSEDLGALLDPLMESWAAWGELLKVPTTSLPPFAVIADGPAQRIGADLKGPPLRVLVVDDEEATRRLMQAWLADECGHAVALAPDGRSALALALEQHPQVVLTDWVMPEMDGIELTRALRATDWGRSIYVIMLTALGSEDQLETAFAEGVDDYLTKPFSQRALRARLMAAGRYVRLQEDWSRDRAQLKRIASELAVSNRKLERAALTDALTALPNRRAAISILGQAWSASRRSEQPLSVMMIDIDRFKSINDRHGHAGGDVVLAAVAKLLRESARKDDWVCRTGGEEFLVICPNSPLEAAAQSAERLRKTVAGKPLTVDGKTFAVTVSIGIASRESDTPDADALVSRADEGLYEAKKSGRNRCCLVRAGRKLLGPE
ncbi:MAG: HDOD domain-containing protein [Rhodocyclaceae bacterium]|nr:HDOD domain-containing protein [Rhodocyclaceae bacterium]